MPAKITHGYAKMWHDKRKAGICSRPSFHFFGAETWFLLPIAFAVPPSYVRRLSAFSFLSYIVPMVLESIHGGFSETVVFHILLEIPDFPAEFPDAHEYRDSEEDKNDSNHEEIFGKRVGWRF